MPATAAPKLLPLANRLIAEQAAALGLEATRWWIPGASISRIRLADRHTGEIVKELNPTAVMGFLSGLKIGREQVTREQAAMLAACKAAVNTDPDEDFGLDAIAELIDGRERIPRAGLPGAALVLREHAERIRAAIAKLET